MHWDTVSFFIVKDIKYLRDLETAVNRIAKPKHSIQKGRVGDERLFARELRKIVSIKKRKIKEEQERKDQEAQKLKRKIAAIESVMKKDY